MKKLILVCSTFLAFGVTGLLAEDTPATVTLPTPPTPTAAAPSGQSGEAGSNAGHGSHGGGHKGHKGGHKGHHKKKGDQDGSSTPAPKP